MDESGPQKAETLAGNGESPEEKQTHAEDLLES